MTPYMDDIERKDLNDEWAQMHISTGVAQLMREEKVREFYFKIERILVYQMLQYVLFKSFWMVDYRSYCFLF